MNRVVGLETEYGCLVGQEDRTGGADVFPIRVVAGQTTAGLTISGANLALGDLQSSDPALVVMESTVNPSLIVFSVDVPPGAAPGHADLIVTNPAGDVDTVPGALPIGSVGRTTKFTTHAAAPSGANDTATGRAPTSISAVTVSVDVSMTETLSLSTPLFVTKKIGRAHV